MPRAQQISPGKPPRRAHHRCLPDQQVSSSSWTRRRLPSTSRHLRVKEGAVQEGLEHGVGNGRMEQEEEDDDGGNRATADPFLVLPDFKIPE